MKRSAWLLPVVCLSLAAPAWADDVKGAAESKFKAGVELAKKGDWARARPLFEESVALHPTASGLLNLALAEEATRSPLEALGHARAFLAHPKADPKAVEETRGTVVPRLWRAVGHLRLRGARGEVTLDGARVAADKLADELDVNPGKHVVDHDRQALAIEVRAGEVKEVDLSARGVDAAPAPQASPSPTEPPPASGGGGVKPSVIAGVSLGLGAVVAGGLGIWFASKASASSERADAALAGDPATRGGCVGSSLAACRDARDAADAQRTQSNVSTALLLGAGGLALGSVAAFVFWPSSKGAAAGVRLSPSPGGATIAGRF